MKWIPGLLPALAAAVFLSGCAGKPQDGLNQIRQQGILTAAVQWEAAGKNHETKMLEQQVVNALAKELNVEVRYESVAEDQLETAVQEKKADLAAGMLIAWDRRQGDFSLTYGRRAVYFVSDETGQVTSLRDLAGTTLGLSGKINRSIRQQFTPVNDLVIQEYNSIAQVKADLKNAAISGYICYEDEAGQLLGEAGIVVRDCPEVKVETYAFTVGEGQQELLGHINQIMTGLLME